MDYCMRATLPINKLLRRIPSVDDPMAWYAELPARDRGHQTPLCVGPPRRCPSDGDRHSPVPKEGIGIDIC